MTAALPLRPYTPLRMVLTVCGQCFTDDDASVKART